MTGERERTTQGADSYDGLAQLEKVDWIGRTMSQMLRPDSAVPAQALLCGIYLCHLHVEKWEASAALLVTNIDPDMLGRSRCRATD